MKRIIFILLLIIVSCTLQAQSTFEKFLGNSWEEGNCVRQTSDGGYIVLGTYTGDGSLILGMLILTKTDSLGNILWRKDAAEYGLICSWGMNLEITNDKGFIITGYTNPCNTNANPFLLKTDFSGNQQWVQIYDSLQTNPMFEPSAQGYDVIQTGDGGYLLTGIAGSFAVDGEIFILKTDSIGNKLWLMKDTGILIATGSSISKAENENYIILGTTTDSILGNGNKYMYLLKIDSNGNKIWGKTYDWNSNNTNGAVVRMDHQENYLLLGTRDSTWDAKEIIFIKTDTNGNILWEKSFKKYNRTYGMDLDISTDLGYIILGAYNNLNDNEDGIYLIKTDSAGSIQWERLIANRGGYSIRQTFDDGYIITGVPSTLLIKTNDTGGVVLNINLSPIEKTSSINVYPNPVINDGFYVSFQTVERSLIIIKLYDYTGKDVCFIRNENQPQGFYKKYIPTNNLPSGLYFLTVTINEKVYSNKIIIF